MTRLTFAASIMISELQFTNQFGTSDTWYIPVVDSLIDRPYIRDPLTQFQHKYSSIHYFIQTIFTQIIFTRLDLCPHNSLILYIMQNNVFWVIHNNNCTNYTLFRPTLSPSKVYRPAVSFFPRADLVACWCTLLLDERKASILSIY